MVSNNRAILWFMEKEPLSVALPMAIKGYQERFGVPPKIAWVRPSEIVEDLSKLQGIEIRPLSYILARHLVLAQTESDFFSGRREEECPSTTQENTSPNT